jgi:hypothetical protein
VGRPSFADVLDDALRARGVGATRTWAAPPPPLPGGGPFLFGRPLTSPRSPWTVRAAGRPAPAPPPPPQRPLRLAPPARQLTPPQQLAFDRLVALGATLTPDFTAAELRRAYRQLALRYHPDRDVDGDDREAMASRFREATASYRDLRHVVEPRH